MTRDTPTSVPVAVGDQAAYDALQDARFRRLRRATGIGVAVARAAPRLPRSARSDVRADPHVRGVSRVPSARSTPESPPMTDDHTAVTMLAVEVAAGAWIAETLAHLPPGVVGAVSAFVVGVVLRLLDAPLRRRSERIDAHLSGAHRAAPPTDPPDDTDTSG